MKLCEIDGCGKASFARKWCKAHYLRWYRGGDPLGASGTERGAAAEYFRETVLLYEGDECLIWPFSNKGNGYAQMMRDGRPQVVSRMVCQEIYGPPPSIEHQSAHSCGNGHRGCVAKKHVRWATPSENEADKIEHGTYSSRGWQARSVRAA